MNLSLNKTLGLALATAVVTMGVAVPSHAANTDWQAQKDAYRVAVSQYRAAKTERHAQVTAIRATFRAAIAAAKAGPAESRKAAIQAARTARAAALSAVAVAPVKPVRPTKPAAAAPNVGGAALNP